MAKKRVEEKETVVEQMFSPEGTDGGMKLDLTPEVETPRMMPQEQIPEEEVKAKPIPTESEHLVNCLRNEKVVVRFIPKETAMVHNKNHILYGGMADTATRNFVVPRLASTGMYKNVLTNSEKAFLEYAMGLEEGALNIYRKTDNFWDDSNLKGIGRVSLRKTGNILDLSIPEEYIKYKILLANKDKICPSRQELEERPKATYEFVIESEGAETKSNLSKMDATMECYYEFGAIKNDKDSLRVIIETLERRPTTSQVKLDYLQSKVKEYIDADPRRFLTIITDKLLPAKVLIKKGLEAGLVSWRNNLYYWKQDNSPLCEMGEESTLNNAAKYLLSPKHSELKYLLEAKLKEE